jgi:iron complex outermembrane receptor protein
MTTHKPSVRQRLLIGAASTAVLMTAAGAAFAQPVADSDPIAVEEIVVTARAREERLLDVPDTITAFGQAEIERAGIAELNDFVRLTPGLSLVEASQSPGIALINVRGVGQQLQSEAPVAVVVDGVQTASVSAINQGLIDVERIEVLKGPQGALYGRNAIGGAINITTVPPSNEMTGRITVGYANGKDEKIEGVLSGPIIPDKLLFRVAAHYNDFEGTIKNPVTGAYINPLRSQFIRGRLLITPTENLTFDLRASHDRTENAGFNASFVPDGDTSDFSLPPSSGRPGHGLLTVDEYAGKVKLQTPIGELSATTAYVKTKDVSDYDLDQSPVDFLDLNLQSTGIKAWSQELRITSKADQRLRYTGGFYYVATERERITDVEIVPFALHLQAHVNDDNKAWAAFGQINYDLTDTVELTLAGRYDSDEREQTNVLTAANDPDRTVSNTFEKFQPKASIAWKINPQTNLYATAAQGFRSGGFNTPGPIFNRVYNAELTTNFEVGIKTLLLDNRLALNVAAFTTKFEDQQIQLLDITSGQQGIVNIPETENKGVEVDFTARLTSRLTLSGGFGYLSSEITSFPALTIVEGNRPPYSPEWTWNLAADYVQPLSGDWELMLRAAVTGQAGMSYEYFDRGANNDDIGYTLRGQPAYALLDLRATIRNDRWTLTAYADNVTDEKYYADAASNTITGFGDIALRGRTKRYGVELGFRF